MIRYGDLILSSPLFSYFLHAHAVASDESTSRSRTAYNARPRTASVNSMLAIIHICSVWRIRARMHTNIRSAATTVVPGQMSIESTVPTAQCAHRCRNSDAFNAVRRCDRWPTVRHTTYRHKHHCTSPFCVGSAAILYFLFFSSTVCFVHSSIILALRCCVLNIYLVDECVLVKKVLCHTIVPLRSKCAKRFQLNLCKRKIYQTKEIEHKIRKSNSKSIELCVFYQLRNRDRIGSSQQKQFTDFHWHFGTAAPAEGA